MIILIAILIISIILVALLGEIANPYLPFLFGGELYTLFSSGLGYSSVIKYGYPFPYKINGVISGLEINLVFDYFILLIDIVIVFLIILFLFKGINRFPFSNKYRFKSKKKHKKK